MAKPQHFYNDRAQLKPQLFSGIVASAILLVKYNGQPQSYFSSSTLLLFMILLPKFKESFIFFHFFQGVIPLRNDLSISTFGRRNIQLSFK